MAMSVPPPSFNRSTLAPKLSLELPSADRIDVVGSVAAPHEPKAPGRSNTKTVPLLVLPVGPSCLGQPTTTVPSRTAICSPKLSLAAASAPVVSLATWVQAAPDPSKT